MNDVFAGFQFSVRDNDEIKLDNSLWIFHPNMRKSDLKREYKFYCDLFFHASFVVENVMLYCSKWR